ncbi:MAG: 4Fe-4S cluster-binding domain-containing protein [Tessaracoccus sp.]
MSTLRINRMISGITALGPGRRFGLWVQGCELACPGCASVDTWASDGGELVDVTLLAQQLLAAARRDELTGITLTGGEPIDQAAGLAELLDIVAGHPLGADLDVLVFTGYPRIVAERRGSELLTRADTMVAGPYRATQPSTHPLIASANQELVHLTARSEARHRVTTASPTIQVLTHDGELVLVGLPEPGDLHRLRAGLSAQGITMEEVSWVK